MIAMHKRPALLLLLPTPALASDPTALFVLFVEAPLLFLSVVFLGVCLAAPRTGLVLSGLLLLVSLVFVGWAGAGYMESAGGMLLISMAVDIVAILIAIKKVARFGEDRADQDT
jgi:hypothetical protein